MDQNSQAPYFHPPPGQTGAPPPLPPRREAAPNPYSPYPGYGQAPPGNQWGGNSQEFRSSSPYAAPITRKPVLPPREAYGAPPPIPPRPDFLRSDPVGMPPAPSPGYGAPQPWQQSPGVAPYQSYAMQQPPQQYGGYGQTPQPYQPSPAGYQQYPISPPQPAPQPYPPTTYQQYQQYPPPVNQTSQPYEQPSGAYQPPPPPPPPIHEPAPQTYPPPPAADQRYPAPASESTPQPYPPPPPAYQQGLPVVQQPATQPYTPSAAPEEPQATPSSSHNDSTSPRQDFHNPETTLSILEQRPWYKAAQERDRLEMEANIAAGYGYLYEQRGLIPPPPPIPENQTSHDAQPPSGVLPNPVSSETNTSNVASDATASEPLPQPGLATGTSPSSAANLDGPFQFHQYYNPPANTSQPPSNPEPSASYEPPALSYADGSSIAAPSAVTADTVAQGLEAHANGVAQPQDEARATQPTDSALLTAISDLTSEFGKLNATEPDASAAVPAANRDVNQELFDDGEWIRPPPLLEEREEPSEVAWDCTGARELTYETNWYHLPDIPEFTICTKCHEMFVLGTKLAEHVEKVRLPKGRCRFNVPRVTDQLMPQLRKDGDIEPIKEYMTKRLQIAECSGLGGVDRSEGQTWYRITAKPEGLMGVFVVCVACYEELVAHTSYANFLESFSPEATGSSKVVCDCCFDYIPRSIREYSRKGKPFSEWMVTAETRYKLPQCEGKAVESASRSWVRPRETVEHMVICETCYYDKIALTCLDDEFEYIPIPKSRTGSEWMDHALGYRTDPVTSWICDAPDSSVAEALLAAKKRKDMSLFVKGGNSYIAGPACTKDGIIGGTWYTLVGGCDSYNVCSLCYVCCVEVWGLERFYEKAETTGSTDAIVCNFHPTSPRFMPCMLRLSQAMETGVWSVFSDFVKTYLKIALCPGYEHVGSLRWYGYDDCLICEECYESFCKHNSPGPGVELQLAGVVIEEIRMCCMYSPRMRGKWLEACEKGDATELLEFSRHRHGVYVQTVPQIKMMREMQQMQMMQGMHAGYMSVVYQGIQGIQTVSGTTDGYEHGNSSIGWHETEAGATSAQFFNQMGSDFRAANSSGSWMAIFRLVSMWSEVE